MKSILVIPKYLIILCLISCEESLDFYPPDSVSENVFWEREKDAVLAVNSIYRNLDGPEFTVCLDGITDIGYIRHGWVNLFKLGMGIQDPIDDDIHEIWFRYYSGIRKANDLLKNISRIEGGGSDILNRVVGEAKVLRAYFYSNLASLWGDVPLIKNPESINEQIANSPKSEVVDFIITELNEVIDNDLLPISYESSDIGRITKGAALALKARICLRNELWRETANSTKAVIDLGVYELYPSYSELFKHVGENSREIILSKQYTRGGLEYDGSNEGAFFWGPASIGGFSYAEPTRKLFSKYGYKDYYSPEDPYLNIDPRWKYTVYYPGSKLSNSAGENLVYNSLPYKTNFSPDKINSQSGSTSHGWNIRKYIDYSIDKANPSSGTMDMILIRYADVLLMYAEAKVELNEIDNSVYEAINLIRKRPDVDMPPIVQGKSQIELRAIIRNERAVELAFEGLRIYDLFRWSIGDEKDGLVKGLEYLDTESGQKKIWDSGIKRIFNPERDYRWPIPQREIDLNKNIVQNPSY